MTKNFVAPPAPEVVYLTAIFRRIETGDIRIPAFQRPFVWAEDQVLELLESVYKGYPIGSVLFWRVNERLLRIERDDFNAFPTVDEHYPLSFVLDGRQRLSTLFGVFNWPYPEQESIFNVVFDLRTEQFRLYDPEALPEAYIHLPAVFSPRLLLDVQRTLADKADADTLIDRSIKLHSSFQEYLVPTVTIVGRSVAEVVEIFERINNTGVRLSAVDFMRALTWSEAFDLNTETVHLQNSIAERGYHLQAETLVKAITVLLGKAPTAVDMLTLRNCSPDELRDATGRAYDILARVTSYLKREFGILSAEFIPYEGQLLVATKLFSETPDPDTEVLSALSRWIWSISFSEGLRGKPDHYVARAISDAGELARGNLGALEYRLKVAVDDLLDRRFIRAKALSSAIASTFAVRGARSLFSGEEIDPEFYMKEFSAENFEGLYPLDRLRAEHNRHLGSAKIFANIVVVTESERKLLRSSPATVVFQNLFERFGAEAEEILNSQLIPPHVAQHALSENVDAFLVGRAAALYGAAAELTSTSRRLGSESEHAAADSQPH